MNRLIADYFRRKWWILLLGAVVELAVGWKMGSDGAGAQTGISILGFQVALFMGAVLLSFDLQFGLSRAALALPLTPKQIGRSWWLATVALPGLGIGALLFAGAGLACLFQPATTLPVRAAMEIWGLIFVWLGLCFVAIFNLRTGLGGNGWDRLRNTVVGGLWGFMLGGGFLLFQNWPRHPIIMFIFTVLGSLATIYGWLKADRLILNRACYRPTSGAGTGRKIRSQVPAGPGGVPFLVVTVAARCLLMGLTMLAIFGIVMVVQNEAFTPAAVAQRLLALCSFFPLWLVVLVQLLPVMLQLRFLRSLPLSDSQLALVLLALTVVPLMVLGLLLAGSAGVVLGLGASLTLLKAFSFALISASLCIFFSVWYGIGRSSYGLAVVVMSLAQVVPLLLHVDQAPLLYILLAAFGVMAGVFGLVRHSLARRSKPYRIPTSLTTVGWGWGWNANR